jgi:hypothetical protein
MNEKNQTMNPFEIIDTFPAFQTYWAGARNKPMSDQIERWAKEYMSGWPELLEKQVEDYAEQNLDWKDIARERIFPDLQGRLPDMRKARRNLLKLCPGICSRAEQVLGLQPNAYLVIYVGIGCGAGWVTTFRDRYSILFGLENIAECGWSDPEAIAGLVSHELGHVLHYNLRLQNNKKIGSGAWWQLYTEGFAQHCEDLMNASAHQETGIVTGRSGAGKIKADWSPSLSKRLTRDSLSMPSLVHGSRSTVTAKQAIFLGTR